MDRHLSDHNPVNKRKLSQTLSELCDLAMEYENGDVDVKAHILKGLLRERKGHFTIFDADSDLREWRALLLVAFDLVPKLPDHEKVDFFNEMETQFPWIPCMVEYLKFVTPRVRKRNIRSTISQEHTNCANKLLEVIRTMIEKGESGRCELSHIFKIATTINELFLELNHETHSLEEPFNTTALQLLERSFRCCSSGKVDCRELKPKMIEALEKYVANTTQVANFIGSLLLELKGI